MKTNMATNISGKSFFILVILFVFLMTSASSHAERSIKRVNKKLIEHKTALIIGNSDYKNAPLKNPANDAKGMSKVLKERGWLF